MKNKLSHYTPIVFIITLIILGCNMDADHGRDNDKCRLISYQSNGIPIYMIYDNDKTLISGNYFSPGNAEIRYDHDNQGHLTKVVSLGKHIIGDTIIADYTCDGNRLRILKYYDRQYDINSGPSEKRILTCNFYYNKSDRPDSMQVVKSRVDSTGREYIFEPIRLDKFLFDSDDNLTKQETYMQEADGRFAPVATSYHRYDNKANFLKQLKQIHFLIDQSIPYMFSKNNVVATRREVSGKHATEMAFKIIYDGDMLIDDGMGFAEIKWSCE
ncbi:hypothetical protein [Dyadobacter aurulentus]|uniref:hypothetical protein n=1 Tax=Dyadobacter sp. UC 10 TaxID=2605428 RepID=UPI0011F0A1DE|nr:hypothetical protein [Dyadobacter sp. UC 10]KAA0992799.1 hypothetical protein FXO21_22785 [Dyadobacter sp. UC 10]